MKKFMMFIFVGLLFCTLNSAQADINTASVSLWRVSEATANYAWPASIPGTTPDATFNVQDSPLAFSYTGGTVQNWLDSGSAFNIAENTSGTLASLIGTPGTIFEFTGLVTVTNGQSITATHDDGMTLIINGYDLGFYYRETAPMTETKAYTGPSGTFGYQLVYAENHSGPAVLEVDLHAVPVPGAVLLGILGLSAAGIKLRRFA